MTIQHLRVASPPADLQVAIGTVASTQAPLVPLSLTHPAVPAGWTSLKLAAVPTVIPPAALLLVKTAKASRPGAAAPTTRQTRARTSQRRRTAPTRL